MKHKSFAFEGRKHLEKATKYNNYNQCEKVTVSKKQQLQSGL